MTAIRGEYRVRQHPDVPGRILVTWRPTDVDSVWFHVAVVDDIHEAAEAMVHHKNRNDQ